MVTVHALGGVEMMQAAKEALEEGAYKQGSYPPMLLAVTVLTSHTDDTLSSSGIAGGTRDTVLRLAEQADIAGVDGLVASAHEAELLRSTFGDRFKLVVPGIRLGTDAHDQKRISTPAEAVRRGADYLVIGRAVSESPYPEDMVDSILASLVETKPA